jgi:uncharacterized protein (DUF4415 family)
MNEVAKEGQAMDRDDAQEYSPKVRERFEREGMPAAVSALIQKTRGRPKGSGTKDPVKLRLDREVIAHFKAGGEGWQTRINDALRSHVGLTTEVKGRNVERGTRTDAAKARKA